MNKVFIIAEAGVNHNASLDMALKLVDAAIDAGADAVKFQTAVPELVVTEFAEKAEYQKEATGRNESQLEMTRKLHLPLNDFDVIKNYCDSRGILFFSTAFDMKSLEYLINLGQKYHKIPSGEITNLPYLRRIGQSGLPIILSSGMARLGEIEEAISILTSAGTKRDDITVLHCHTDYPTKPEDVNLLAMRTIADALKIPVGYSDHTMGIHISVAAVALGAVVIEKHLTLDHNLPGPDHAASLEPEEFKTMVTAIRDISAALGNGIKQPTPREDLIRPLVRRSLVASRLIHAGEVFSIENIVAKRPGTGISAMRWDEVIGQKACREFQKDELIVL